MPRSRTFKWALGAFLVHGFVAAWLVTVGVHSDSDFRIEAARALSRLEFAVEPAVSWLLQASAPAIRGAVAKFNLPVTSVIKGFAYPAYILLGGVFYGAIAGLFGWVNDRRTRGTPTDEVGVH